MKTPALAPSLGSTRSRGSGKSIATIVGRLLSWFRQHARDLPWRRTQDPYAIWVSEIMLQQTQVKTVIPYWSRWMETLPTIQELARAAPDQLHKLWEGLGYYTRVRNLHRAAQQILSRNGGTFPEQVTDLLELPGIGRYTAGAIASIAYNQPHPILDGNVMRVLTRIFMLEGDPRRPPTNTSLWELSRKLVEFAATQPDRACAHFNQSLMELGALICLPTAPDCPRCPVRSECQAYRTSQVHRFPELKPRAAVTHRSFIAFVVEKNGRYLVRQRPAHGVNAHLWEFPNVETSGPGESSPDLSKKVNGSRAQINRNKNAISVASPKGAKGSALRLKNGPTTHRAAGDHLGFQLDESTPICTIQHSITRYRITLQARRARLRREPRAADGCWKSPEELDTLAFASAHRKILQKVLTTPRGG